MLTTYLFRYTSECTISSSNFQNFLRLRQGDIARPGSSLHQVDVCTSLVVHGKIIAALSVKGHLIVPRTRLEFGKRTFAFAGPGLGTVCLTLCEVLNLSTLSKDDLNPFYFLSHALAFHSQLLHVLPLPRINCVTRPCNVPWHVTARYKLSFYYYYYYY